MMYTMSIEVKIKKLHPEAVIPTYAKLGDAGMDLYAVEYEMDDYGNFVYNTGLEPAHYICCQDSLLLKRSLISQLTTSYYF